MRLNNKIAIVTGSADGIGLATSKALAVEGASVIMLDINGKKNDIESERINNEGGVTEAITCSVGNVSDMTAAVHEVIENYGRIGKSILKMTEEEWDVLMDINLKGVFNGIKLVLPHMIEQGSGSIINMSSVQGLRSWDDWTAYAAAKGGVNALTVQLAGQYGANGIRVNAIAPGAIMTPLNENRIAIEGEEFLEASIQQSALRRMGESEEVAKTVVFLASEESAFIPGEIIRVDGGLGVLPRYFNRNLD